MNLNLFMNLEVSNEGSYANISHAPVLEPEVANEASDANILQAPIQGFTQADIKPDPRLRKQIGEYTPQKLEMHLGGNI